MSVDDEIEEGLNSNLLHVSLDYSNVRDILVELSNRIESLHNAVNAINESKTLSELKSEINNANERIDTLSHNMNAMIASSNTASEELKKQFSNLSDRSMEMIQNKEGEIQETMNKILKESLDNILEDLRNNEFSNFCTMDMHNDLMFTVEQIGDNITKLNKNPLLGKNISDKIEELERRTQELENNEINTNKAIEGINTNLGEVTETIKQLNETKTILENKMEEEEKSIENTKTRIDEHIEDNETQNDVFRKRLRTIEEKIGKIANNENAERLFQEKLRSLEDKINTEIERMVEEKESENANNVGDISDTIDRIDECLENHQNRIANIESIVTEVGEKTGVDTSRLNDETQTDAVLMEDGGTSPFLSRQSTARNSQKSINLVHNDSHTSLTQETNNEAVESQRSLQKQDTVSSRSIAAQQENEASVRLVTPQGSSRDDINTEAEQISARTVNSTHSTRQGTAQNSGRQGTADEEENEVCAEDNNQESSRSRKLSARPSSFSNVNVQRRASVGESRPMIPILANIPSGRVVSSNRNSGRNSSRGEIEAIANLTKELKNEHETMKSEQGSMKEDQNTMKESISDIGTQIEECKEAITRLRKGMKAEKEENAHNLVAEALNQIKDLSNKFETISGNYVSKEKIDKVLRHISAAMDKINNHIATKDEQIEKFLTKEDFAKYIKEISRGSDNDNSTAAATSGYRCLLCGKPKSGVAGMITDAEIARLMGEPTSCTPSKVGSDTYILNYGATSLRPKTSSTIRKPKSRLPKIGD